MSRSYRPVLFAHGKLKSAKHVITNKPLHNIRRSISVCNNLAAKVSFNLSDIGEGIREVVVKEWFVKEGDKVAQFDNICEVQSDKASVTITSRYDGVISKLHHNIDDIALVGKPLVDIETDEGELSLNESKGELESPLELAKPQTIKDNVSIEKGNVNKARINFQRSENNTVSNPTSPVSREPTTVLAIPAVRKFAIENNVDLSIIPGSGKEGRVLQEDIIKFMEKSKTPETSVTSYDRMEPIKGFQRVMVKTMTESLKIPHFTYGDEIKVTQLSQLRKELKKENISLSFLPFFVKSVSNALKKYPILNTSIDEKCENIYYHSSHNIGIAMDTKVGLAVPVVRNVQNLEVMEIAEEVKRLIISGREGNFAPSDLAAGTFTVSNIGSIGGTYTKPVILPPQVAILAVGRSQVVPRFDENKSVIAEEVVNISGAADHRIVDGATMANFVNILKRQLETPHLLLLNL